MKYVLTDKKKSFLDIFTKAVKGTEKVCVLLLSVISICVGAFDSADRFGHDSPGFVPGLSLSW